MPCEFLGVREIKTHSKTRDSCHVFDFKDTGCDKHNRRTYQKLISLKSEDSVETNLGKASDT